MADWKTPLLAPVAGDHRALSPAARDEILALLRPRPLRFLARLALTWATIVAVIVLAVWADSWPVTVAASVAVATRQIVLGLLTSRSTTWACPSAPATPWSTSWPAFRSCS